MDAASSEPGTPLGPGRVVLIVGPSGAGKDTLIALAREKLGERRDVVFPSRFVTREPTAAENNFPISHAEFEEAVACNQLALHWEAHGHWYGISADIDYAVKNGATVVVNVSRSVVAVARQRYRRVDVVYVDAPIALRFERIAQRGRENSEDTHARVIRTSDTFCLSQADLLIVNDREPVAGGQQLFAFLARSIQRVT